MNAVTAAILGVVQGLTEFLPISSSAHLIFARGLLGWDAGRLGLAFDVACHAGTLVAVMVYFRQALGTLAGGAFGLLQGRGSEAGRSVLLFAVATVPVAVVGLVFGDLIESRLRTPGVAAAALAVGAFCFLGVERRVAHAGREGHEGHEGSLSVRAALAIGVAQALALVPGVSRSGATIVMGLLVGLRRDAAARFGFVLGIPAIMAATAREWLALGETTASSDVVWVFSVGAVTSGLVGYVTVRYLMHYLAEHSLGVFAGYRLILAAAFLLWWIWAS